ncbi:MAG: DUF1800 family protein [Puniceicoccaceae bacterium]
MKNWLSNPGVSGLAARETVVALVLLLGAACMPVKSADVDGFSLSAEEKAAHALNRLGYGPRPGEVEAVAGQGVENWIREQLDPSLIADSGVEAAVDRLSKLRLSQQELVEAYRTEIRERALLRRAEADGDPARAAELRRMRRSGEQLIVEQALGELQYAKLLRAVLSERQLEEVLVDFWFNHFNVDARKQQVRPSVVSYERDVIRPRVFGSFRDLLGATAESPAMLVYLDNFRSTREMELSPAVRARTARMREEPLGRVPQESADGNAAPERRGLNENYGRELLELHTLGVDGGYTQEDVREVARAFTGWSVRPRTGEFIFRPRWHDDGEKEVLGTILPAGNGRRDGEAVLDLIASHPATATRIATKLCQRFVADEPPEDLVDRVATAFRESDGDLLETYKALFFDPVFFSPEFFAAKTKSPFEYAASALRASGAELHDDAGWRGRRPLRAMEAGAALGGGGDRLSRLRRKTVGLHLLEMGQAPYTWGSPTGFPEDSREWVSSGALLARLNFSLALVGGDVFGAKVDPAALAENASGDAGDVVESLAQSVLGRAPSAGTLAVLLERTAPAADGMGRSQPDIEKLLALVLGSPEFQYR